MNKRKNDIVTDINMTAGSEKVDRKNIHVYMLSVEPGESNAIGEIIAITIATTTAIQINLISIDIKLIAVELICIQIPPVVQKILS